jgi:hypothetical protein
MKITIIMKTPDALRDAIERTSGDEVGGPLDSPEHDERFHELVNQTMTSASKWFKYEECVTLELDTITQTCVVVPN